MEADEIDAMTQGYITAALFTADESIVEPKSGEFDASPYLGRIPAKVKAEARKVCEAFYTANSADLAGYPASAAGHDLWFTRCGHGCGFWECDHCDKAEGERLTKAAHALREAYLYRGDGGWLYIG